MRHNGDIAAAIPRRARAYEESDGLIVEQYDGIHATASLYRKGKEKKFTQPAIDGAPFGVPVPVRNYLFNIATFIVISTVDVMDSLSTTRSTITEKKMFCKMMMGASKLNMI